MNLQLDGSQDHWQLPLATTRVELRCDALTQTAELRDGDRVVRRWTDPLAALSWLAKDARSVQQPTHARWVGYLSYDLGRQFESLPAMDDDAGLPLFAFALVDGDEHAAVAQNDGSFRVGHAPLVSTFDRAGYESAVARAIEYIRGGDVFQVNLSQRFTVGLPASPAAIYQRMRLSTPAAYGAFLDLGDFSLLSNSPELFFHVVPDVTTGKRRIITRPVKGTRPRRPGMDVALLHSAKDAAELNMIVDLERNDLGRVCETGSVRVAQPRTIETHPTVFHGVATIEGVLREDAGFVDLLRAIFPGGSVTGAPKIRAMQIIDELEPVRRGPYCGAIGYLAADGTMCFNVAIRTMVAQRDVVHISVGGGIVADSDPAAEYEETLVKAQAMFAALGIAAPG